jgi:uncharacterized protein YciI
MIAALTDGGFASRAGATPGGPAPYYVVFLRPNPDRKPIAPADRERIMAAHMANIQKMADDGILVAAGPMDDKTTTISGIFVFRCPSLEEARRVAALDPTVAEGRNTVDVHAWRGPPGIGDAYFRNKKEHPEAKDAMAVHILCILKRGTVLKIPPDGDSSYGNFVESLRVAGVPAVAGPVEDDPALVGIIIFKAQPIEEAMRIVSGLPDVHSEHLVAELHRWWSADGVMPW